MKVLQLPLEQHLSIVINQSGSSLREPYVVLPKDLVVFGITASKLDARFHLLFCCCFMGLCYQLEKPSTEAHYR